MFNFWLKQMAVVCVATAVSSCGKTILKNDTRVVKRPGLSDANKDQKNKSNSNGKDLSGLTLRDLQSAYGIRSFDQVIETMGVLTGVDPGSANIQTVYSDVKSQLPTNNDIKTFLASQQVGVSKLAVEFCDQLINNGTLRAQLVPGFNFASGPQTAFQGTGKADLIDGLTDSFWGTNLENLPDEGASFSVLSDLIDDLNAGENLGNATTTINTAKGVCTAVLSAAPVMIF